MFHMHVIRAHIIVHAMHVHGASYSGLSFIPHNSLLHPEPDIIKQYRYSCINNTSQ